MRAGHSALAMPASNAAIGSASPEARSVAMAVPAFSS